MVDDWQEADRTAAMILTRYNLNASGLPYASQGFHVGDTVTLSADVIYWHKYLSNRLTRRKKK